MAIQRKSIIDVVASRVKEFQEKQEIHFPANYSPENAMKSAWLILQSTKTGKNDGFRPALEVCTKDSIANALLDMVVQGLNPTKKQGYFLVYGKQLVFQRSYFGTMAVTKRVTGAKSIDAQVIYEGDSVEYEIINARITNLVHKQKFGSVDKDKIIGAYATITLPNNEVYIEIMTIEEIRKAWSKSQSWGKDQTEERTGSVHDEFRQEMAKKTVINRACKKFLNSSDDGSIMMKHVNGDETLEDDVETEIQENANGEVIDIQVDPEPVEDAGEVPDPEIIIDPEPKEPKKDAAPF